MEKKAFLKQVLESGLQAGFSECEVYYRGGRESEVLVLEGEVANYENSTAEGIAFRGTIHGRTGCAYTRRLTADAIPYLLTQAKENAAVLSEGERESLYAGEAAYPTLACLSQTAALTAEEKIAAAKRMETAALSGAEEIASLDYCALGTETTEIAIQNTKGLDVAYSKGFTTAYVSAIARKGAETKTDSCFWKGQDWAAFDPEATGREAALRAAAHLGAAAVPSGAYDVVLDGRAMVALLGAFAGVFYGETVQKGFSLLGGKTGQQIASPAVTLRDDALLAGGYASVPFDSEGVSGKNKAVIENGALRTLLYNRQTAERDGVVSTGNGFRAGLTGAVKTACTNFYLAAGEAERDALLAELGDGLYLTGLMGLHAGANAVSGDFSLSAEGFCVENGRLARPVEQITVAGNFYRLLEGIEAVGADLYFSPAGIGSPSVLVRGMDIAGA